MTYTKPEPGKPIVIEIGDRLLELRFSLKTLKALDKDEHISVLKAEGITGIFSDPTRLAVVLYYGLKTKDPTITLDWVEENVDASMLLDLAPLLILATTGRCPDMDKLLGESPNVPVPGQIQTGSLSGPSDATT
jgi:hypothetical protein